MVSNPSGPTPARCATLRQTAEAAAKSADVTLMTATGTSDVDAESQKAAFSRMIEDGAQGILIAPTIAPELLPLVAAAREDGVLVYAIDTAFAPEDAVDAYLATDNAAAGHLAGQYARVKSGQLGLTPKIAMLDLAPGIASGEARQAGFLSGFGIGADDPAIVARADTEGNQELGRQRMAEILSGHPDVNVIYTVNEPAALGAIEALREAGADLNRVVLVSIDGGCQAIKGAVRRGDIDATAMQFPQNMAREGVNGIAEALRGEGGLSGFLDTGVRLITDDPAPGVPSADVAFGVRNCWG